MVIESLISLPEPAENRVPSVFKQPQFVVLVGSLVVESKVPESN